jgi:hypothetical protein
MYVSDLIRYQACSLQGFDELSGYVLLVGICFIRRLSLHVNSA